MTEPQIVTRYCPDCHADTEVERVPAKYQRVTDLRPGRVIHQAVPPYEICIPCGHYYGHLDDDDLEGAVTEPDPEADDGPKTLEAIV